METPCQPLECMRTPNGFLKCANGTHLPLTVREASASMGLKQGKIFSCVRGAQIPAYAWNHYHPVARRTSEGPGTAFWFCKNPTRGCKDADLGGR